MEESVIEAKDVRSGNFHVDTSRTDQSNNNSPKLGLEGPRSQLKHDIVINNSGGRRTPPGTSGGSTPDQGLPKGDGGHNDYMARSRDSKSSSITPPSPVSRSEDNPTLPASPEESNAKRRRFSNGFAAINATTAPSKSPRQRHPLPRLHQISQQVRLSVDPLPGTRPTRILLGFWKPSSEPDARDRHAVYGILGQNDMFRVKVVRETRDGRFVDGNFPSGAGALWIAYEDVEFEDYLRPLSRQEIKEYCRIRQYQIDHGETSTECAANLTQAVYEAQARASAGAYKHVNQPLAPAYHTIPPERTNIIGHLRDRQGHENHEPRQSHQSDTKHISRPHESFTEYDRRQATRLNQADAYGRTQSIARRETARVEAARGITDRHTINRERAVAAITDAASAAAVAASAPYPVHVNSRPSYHESEDIKRLNNVWARQETSKITTGTDDVKIYDGVKYVRKPSGPFMGKLASQGTIINIDGDDYVEYRVLTKPSFF